MRTTYLALALILFMLLPAAAQNKRELKATLKVLKFTASGTSNPSESLYELSVQVTNAGKDRLAFSNNSFLLVDDSGKRHVVNRGRYPERFDLAPGETATADRIFFTLPRDSKPVAAQLVLLRGVVGEAKL
ncbi:MAG: hypothetical protein AB1758_21455 [Candidatus Eremiobacterota bacterium]